jgi:hypothetical protein
VILTGWSDSRSLATVEMEVPMICNFDKICLFFDKKLSINQQLELLGHLDHCDICLEAARQIKRDRDAGLYVQQKPNNKPANGAARKRYLRARVRFGSAELNSQN